MQTDLLTGLTPKQYEAVTHDTGPCLVIAGAGTGKTMVITKRILHLILNKGVAPERILALTFTDKAAREMEERVDKELPYGMTGTAISTFHSFCADLVKRHAFVLGISPQARIMTTADEVALLRRNLDALPANLYKPGKNPVEFLRNLAKFISTAREEHVAPSALIDHATARLEEAKETADEADIEAAELLLERALLYEATETIYRDNGALSYADLMYYAVDLLTGHPSVRKDEQDRLDYILVDEYQDTNAAQSAVVYALAGTKANLMVVGDDDQAIYAFRGANISNILGFSSTYPQRTVVTLTDNFRSTQPILDAAYRLICHNNPHRLEVQEQIDKQLTSHYPGTEPVEHWHFSHSAYECQAIAERIKELNESGTYQYRDCAVLVRARSHARGIEAALASLGIPTAMQSEIRLYDEPSVQSALRFLRFLTDPHNDVNVRYLLTQPPFELPETTLAQHAQAARYLNASFFDYLRGLDAAELDEELAKTLGYLTDTLNAIRATPSHNLLHFLHDSGWYAQLLAADDMVTTEYLAALLQEIQQFEQLHPHTTLHEYVEHIDSLLATDEDISIQNAASPEEEGVKIMTIHRSKGLEFPVVFVPMLVEGRFPSRNQHDPFPFPEAMAKGGGAASDRLSEERRLAYVAFTRAKDVLVLSSSEMYEERKTKAKLSPFLIEALGLSTPPTANTPALPNALPESPAAAKSPARQIPVPGHFAASSFEAYLQCPHKFRFQYVMHLKVPATGIINFGTSVHAVLQQWFIAKGRGEVPDLDALYKACWISGGYESKKIEEERYAEGLQQLRSYLAGPLAQTVPESLEQSIRYRLNDGTVLRGKIDRTDRQPDGTVTIIDYKTGDRPSTEKELAEQIPMSMYALALTQAKQPVGNLELHYVMRGEAVRLPISSLDLEGRHQVLEDTWSAIKESYQHDAFPPKPHKILCQYCEYRDVCPFRYGKR